MRKKKLIIKLAFVALFVIHGTDKAFAWLYTLPDIGLEVSYDYNYVYPTQSVYPLTFGLGMWLNLFDWGGPTMSASFGSKKKTKFFYSEPLDAKTILDRASDYHFVLSPGFCTGICSIKLGLGGCRIYSITTTTEITSQSLYNVDSYVANINADGTASWTFLFQPAFTLNVPIVPNEVVLPLRVGYNYVPEYRELCGLFVGASLVFGF